MNFYEAIYKMCEFFVVYWQIKCLESEKNLNCFKIERLSFTLRIIYLLYYISFTLRKLYINIAGIYKLIKYKVIYKFHHNITLLQLYNSNIKAKNNFLNNNTHVV